MTQRKSASGTGAAAAEIALDERGRVCPHPVIALGRAAKSLPPGAVIELLADDPAAAIDVPAWCRMKGARYLGAEAVVDSGETGTYRYRVRLSEATPPSAGDSV